MSDWPTEVNFGTPPDTEAVARLVALLTEAGDKAFNRGDTNDADLYDHAAACVRFVAALDEMDRDKSSDRLQYNGFAQGWYYEPEKGGRYFGETKFAAFCAGLLSKPTTAGQG